MSIEIQTDSRGNTLSLVRQIPSFGFELTLTAKDGTSVSFVLTGESLTSVAEELKSATSFAEQFGR